MSASARTAAVKGFSSGPPSAKRVSGRLESTLEVAVAGLVGGTAGRGDPGAHQGDHQIARVRTFGCHHLGHRDRPYRGSDAHPYGRGQAEPSVRGVVQCPRVLGGVDGTAGTPGAVVVHQPESTADHGVADLTHRHRAGHRARPPQPHQAVRTDEFIDHGAAVDAVDIGPQCDDLGVAQQVWNTAPPPARSPAVRAPL